MNSAPASLRVVLSHPAGWIASGLGVGLSPRAPGTVGSLVALLPWWFLLRQQPPWIYACAMLLAFGIGVWAANWVIERTGVQDPGVVVWDEFIGQWIALFMLPAGWHWVLVSFVLFRLFDIWKPWPVSWADRKLHGGMGAMLDDVLAGVYALLAVQGLAALVGR